MVGNFFGGAFFGGGFFGDLPSSTPIGGGYHPSQGYTGHEIRRRTKKEIQEEREKLGILPKAQVIIEDVARRQAETLALDEQQRFEELQRELALEKIQFEGKYLEYLNARRQSLIDAEISRLIRDKMESEEVMTLMMMAAICA